MSKFADDYIIVWLDENNSEPDIFFNRTSNLTSILSNVHTFDNVSDFTSFINSLSNDIFIFLIISGKLGEIHIANLHAHSKIFHIYVYCINQEKHIVWVDQFKKIRDIYVERNLLLKQLVSDVTLYSKSLSVPITIFKHDELIRKETSIRNLSKESALFIWNQLLFDIVIKSESSIKARDEMLNEVKREYQNNAAELKKILDFQQNYVSATALRWYTRDCFLYRLVNKSMRTQNIIEIYKYRWFLRDLHEQLCQLHSIQSRNLNRSKVYRGQLISFEELEQMKTNIQGLISLNTYISTSLDQNVAYDFCGRGQGRPNFESVIFIINITENLTTKPFANIQELSYMKSEYEILLSAGTVCRIIDVREPRDDVWTVELEIDNDIEKNFNEFMSYMTTEMIGQPPLMNMGNLLSEMGDLGKAEQYYQLLSSELEHENDAGAVSVALAVIHFRRSEYSNALQYCNDGLNRLVDLAEMHPDLPGAYNIKGMILQEMNQLNDAIICYKHALTLQKKVIPLNNIAIASNISNIASLNTELHNFAEASNGFDECLQIKLSLLPKDHPSVARTYLNMGTLYLKQKDIPMAIDYFDKTLNIQQKMLPPTHPDISLTFINKACAFIEQQNFNTARDLTLQALDIQLKNFPLNSNYLAFTYNQLAIIESKVGNYIQELHSLEKSLQYEQVSQNSWKNICQLQNRIGRIYLRSANFQLALKFFTEALDTIPSTNNDILRFSTSNNIATTYHENGDDKMALKYFQQCMNLLNTMGTPPSNENLISLYQNIGLSYLADKQYDIALDSFARVFSLTEDSTILAKTFWHIGNAHLEQEHYSKALENYDLALEHFAVNDNAIPATYNAIGTAYLHSKDFDNAIQSFHQAINILQAKHPPNINEELAALYSNLANAYLAIEDVTNAKVYFQKQLEYETDDNDRRQLAEILFNL